MVYVIGQAVTAFGPQPERSIISLGREAAAAALADAGIDAARVGFGAFANVFGGRDFGDFTLGQNVFGALGMSRLPVVNVENACTSGSTAFVLAVQAIRAGACEVALVAGVEKMCLPGRGLVGAEQTDCESLAGMAAPVGFAMRAMRHMYEFGTTAAQLAAVTVKSRAFGALNPGAQFRTPETIESVLAAPLIADPLTRSQCCPVADGGAAVVLASAAFARRLARAVRVDAAVLASGSYENGADAVRWETDLRTARLAYEQAGIGPAELGVVECHDAFTIAELLHYEGLGLCAPGEGGRLVERGDTGPGGRIPVNPSGGLLSRGHPVAATGIAQIAEIVVQLRGEAGVRQVARTRAGLAQCMGGDKDADTKSCTVVVLSR